jgi:hypothetical protein
MGVMGWFYEVLRDEGEPGKRINAEAWGILKQTNKRTRFIIEHINQ